MYSPGFSLHGYDCDTGGEASGNAAKKRSGKRRIGHGAIDLKIAHSAGPAATRVVRND